MSDPIIIVNPNPVGAAKDLAEIKAFVDKILAAWKARKAAGTSKFREAVGYILASIDGLIQLVDDLLEVGPDKKATVMAAIILLYDQIVGPSLPIWLKPFSAPIKAFIIDVIISLTIDFIVKKYRTGSWNKESVQEPAPSTEPAPESH